MSITDSLDELRAGAERLAWQLDHSGLSGVGADESRTVRVHLDDAGRVQRIDIDHAWWRDPGPDRLADAVVTAANQAAVNRISAWSERVAERAGAEPPADWRGSLRQRQDEEPHDGRGTAPAGDRDSRTEALLRLSEVTEAALSEMDDYRRRTEARAHQQVLGRSRSDRVTVTYAGDQLSQVEVDRRWLRSHPSGQAMGSELGEACQDAYDRMAQERQAILGSLPALTALRELTADPVTLVHRLAAPR
ncbi:hypothetical protein [Plantactinospora sp. WMMB782]|uniref:hypothetical protein n=1 Tax=Plantactinospora sp. WMMB782 TaxID=3404121 RepID=UPI003B94E128